MPTRSGNKVSALRAKLAERQTVLDQVRAVLPARLAVAVVTAGVDQGRLTIGVAGAVWASRLRYLTDAVRQQLGDALGTHIMTVKVRIVPPAPAPDASPRTAV